MEEKMDVKRRRGRRLEQLLNALKVKRRCWKLKEGALDSTQWRTRFERGYESFESLGF
jgi:hypothetical protein